MKTDLPRWQQLTGFTPDNELDFSPEQRAAAITKLVVEADRIARDEFARGAVLPSPLMGEGSGERAARRTIFWDPVESICRQLGISRVKLSAFTRELIGLRAHELTDRLKAAGLPAIMRADLEQQLAPDLKLLKKKFGPALKEKKLRIDAANEFVKYVRAARKGIARPGWAARLGYPNPSRLTRACLLAHGQSIDALEASIVHNIVQKFVSDAYPDADASAETIAPPSETLAARADSIKEESPVPSPLEGEGRRERSERGERGEPHAIKEEAPLSPEAQALIDDAVQHVIRKSFPAA